MKTIRFMPFALLVLAPVIASAQPDPTNAPKGDNPANRAARVRGQARTPEQRRALIAAFMRQQLVTANVTGQKQQDAVIAFVSDELDARQKIGEVANPLSTAVRGQTMTDAQIAGLLNEYVAALQEDKTRHQKALDTLKASINVSQFPRLEAGLTLLGLWNEAPAAGGAMFGGGGMGGGQGRKNRGAANQQNAAGANQQDAADARKNRAPF